MFLYLIKKLDIDLGAGESVVLWSECLLTCLTTGDMATGLDPDGR
jgi:hypothetical protein